MFLKWIVFGPKDPIKEQLRIIECHILRHFFLKELTHHEFRHS
jgi:hypothetical protein